MASEKEKAAPIELAKPAEDYNTGIEYYNVDDIAAERERWQAKVVEADKSGYRAASRRGCARYARAKKELGRVIDAERAAVDAAVAVGIRFTRFYVSPVAINERADKAEARIKELEKRDKHPQKKTEMRK